MCHRKMEVFFPKFKLDQRYEMHKLLQQMGIRRIFSTSADLSELSAVARNLQVSKASQGLRWGPVLSCNGIETNKHCANHVVVIKCLALVRNFTPLLITWSSIQAGCSENLKPCYSNTFLTRLSLEELHPSSLPRPRKVSAPHTDCLITHQYLCWISKRLMKLYHL